MKFYYRIRSALFFLILIPTFIIGIFAMRAIASERNRFSEYFVAVTLLILFITFALLFGLDDFTQEYLFNKSQIIKWIGLGGLFVIFIDQWVYLRKKGIDKIMHEFRFPNILTGNRKV